MSLTRHLGRDGIAHSNADSATHARHVKARRHRAKIEWVAQPVEETSAIEFRLHDTILVPEQGRYFVTGKDGEQCVAGSEFENHLRSVNQERSWNYSLMKRGSTVSRTKRKRACPACEEFVVNLAPHQMKFLNEEMKLWEAADLSPSDRKMLFEQWIDDLRRTVVSEFQEVSSRDVVGSYTHYDSNKIHFGIIHSRVSAENTLVGEKRLGTVGPWTVAQNRLRKLGMADAADTRLDDNLKLFRARYPDKTPLDIRIHDALDHRFDELVTNSGKGSMARFESAKSYYREWKQRRNQETLYRTPAAQRVAWQTLRLISPLLPSPVRHALSLARTIMNAFSIIDSALNAMAHENHTTLQHLTPQPSKPV